MQYRDNLNDDQLMETGGNEYYIFINIQEGLSLPTQHDHNETALNGLGNNHGSGQNSRSNRKIGNDPEVNFLERVRKVPMSFEFQSHFAGKNS